MSQKVRTYSVSIGLGWMTRKSADRQVARGYAWWRDDGVLQLHEQGEEPRRPVCHAPTLPAVVERYISDARPGMPILPPSPEWLARMGYGRASCR